MGIGAAVAAALEGLASLLNIGATWFRAKQSPAMLANVEAQRRQAVKDAVTSDVQKQDVDATGKDIS